MFELWNALPEVGGAEHRGDDQDPAATDDPGHRRCGAHPRRGPDDGARASVRCGHGPCHARQHPVDIGSVARSDRRSPPARRPAPAPWPPARRSAPGRRRWRTSTEPDSSAAATSTPRSAPARSLDRRAAGPRPAPTAPRALGSGAPVSIACTPGSARWSPSPVRRPAAARRPRRGRPRRSPAAGSARHLPRSCQRGGVEQAAA